MPDQDENIPDFYLPPESIRKMDKRYKQHFSKHWTLREEETVSLRDEKQDELPDCLSLEWCF